MPRRCAAGARLGRTMPIEYAITAYERPSRLVLQAHDDSFTSTDEITFVERAGGTRITYEARIELSGIRRVADPLLDLLFQRIGRVAVRGLRERITGAQARDGEGAADSARRTIARSRPRKT